MLIFLKIIIISIILYSCSLESNKKLNSNNKKKDSLSDVKIGVMKKTGLEIGSQRLLREIFNYRDLGIKDGTNGEYIAHIIKANGKELKDEVKERKIKS